MSPLFALALKLLRKTLIILTTSLSICFSPMVVSAQKTVDVASGNVNALSPAFFNVVGGEPFVMVKFAKVVEGSPYFKEQWMRGNVIVNGGQQYAGIDLKLDLYDNEVHFRGQKGIEMVATTVIQKIILADTIDQQLHTFINGDFLNANTRIRGWYELLSEGDALLLKKFNKQLREFKPYGSATIEQTIMTSLRYYILFNNKLTEVKKLKEIVELLTDKRQDLSQFIANNNLSGKSERDFVMVINYYNGIE